MLEPIEDDEPETYPAFSLLGLEIPGGSGGDTGTEAGPAAAGPSRSGRASRLRVVLGVGLVLAGTGFVLVPRIQWHRTLAPVRDAISAASTAGAVYPETRSLSPEALQRVQEGGGLPPGFEVSMTRLRARFDRDPHDPETAYWLGAGFTVSGQLEKARATVDIGRVHNTHEPRLWILDAILAEREGDPGAARDILQRFLASYPENLLAGKNLEALKQATPSASPLR